MSKEIFTHRLPQARVSRDLYKRVRAVADSQGMSIADVQRAALEWYCASSDTPGPEGRTVKIPIVGIIKDGQIIPYRKAA